MQLAFADIDGMDTARTPQQQKLRKTPGRSADIESSTAAHVNSEILKRRFQLLGSARDVGGRAARNSHRNGRGHIPARLVAWRAGDGDKPALDEITRSRPRRREPQFDEPLIQSHVE